MGVTGKWTTRLVMTAVIAGCGDGGAEGELGECEPRNQPAPFAVGSAVDEHAVEREQCLFNPGDRVVDSVGPDAVVPAAVKHVIVVMQENRSFDEILGQYVPPEGQEFIDPVPDDAHNADPDSDPRGAVVYRFHEQLYCTKCPAHQWSDIHLQFNNGSMNGFVATNNTGPNHDRGCVSMGYYTEEDLPFYYWLARNFSISDSYFSSMLGPTLSNILYYYYATSCGQTDNTESVLYGCPGQASIFELLEGHASYRVYSDSTPTSIAAAVSLHAYGVLDVDSFGDFKDDVANDQLPEVVFVEPNYGHTPFGEQNDGHPPANVQLGQKFVLEVVQTLAANPAVWNSSVVFVTWDEHGGFYDHVVPPKACVPDDKEPFDFHFDQLGIRVPFFVVSPFAKRGYVSHYTLDHTSILRFIQAWKGLGALSKRDANAWPMLDMFDFANPRPPPVIDPSLGATSDDPIHVAACSDPDPISSCVQ